MDTDMRQADTRQPCVPQPLIRGPAHFSRVKGRKFVAALKKCGRVAKVGLGTGYF